MTDVTTFKTNWEGNTKGKGTVQSSTLNTKIAIPESLGGSGEGTEPKELLVTSAVTCYTMTLVTILETRHLPVVHFSIDSEASNSEEGFKIIHYPHIQLSADATDDQIKATNRAIIAADKGCTVGNMLKKADVQIEVEGNVTLS